MTATSDLTLSPGFVAGTTTYTLAVANGVDEVTLSATATDGAATVAIADDTDTTTPEEATFSLGEGANTLTVVVTAEDGSTQDYTGDGDAATPPALVSNIMSGTNGTQVVGGASSIIVAQRFTVDPGDSWLLSSVTIKVDGSSNGVDVAIHEGERQQPGGRAPVRAHAPGRDRRRKPDPHRTAGRRNAGGRHGLLRHRHRPHQRQAP